MKKLLTTFLSATLVVSANATIVQAEDKNAEFDEFLTEQFVETMESDYLSLHFTVGDYESYGIEKPELIVGDYTWDDYAESVEENTKLLKELEAFDYDALSDSQKVDYDAMHFYLERLIAMDSYPYHEVIFDESGALNNLTTNFTEFVFYEKQDIDDYLAVLETVPAYLDQLLDITKIQAENGYFLTSAMLEATLDSIDKFVEKTDDNELIVIFENRIDNFEGLTDEEIASYKAQNRDIVINEYIPKYAYIGEELKKLEGSRVGDYSVYSLKDGDKYYAEYAKYKTSLDISVQEMLDLCTDYLNDVIAEYITLIQTADYDALEEEMDMDDAYEVLEYLKTHLDDFPDAPEVNYIAEELDPSVASESIVAYYMTPRIDDVKNNVIKINPAGPNDNNDLYETLAHEGYPGHLYQFTYYYSTDFHPVRSVLSFSGYTEGWAMYAEGQAMGFAPMSEAAAKYVELNTSISYVMDAAIDLGVNGLGWSINDVEDYLESIDLNPGIAESLYDFVTLRPAQILPYGVGLAKFESLEKYAREQLGDAYSQKEFNQVLVDNGNRPFSVVERDLVNYIAEKTGSEPTSTPSASSGDTSTSTSSINAGFIVVGGAVVLLGAIVLIRVLKKRS